MDFVQKEVRNASFYDIICKFNKRNFGKIEVVQACVHRFPQVLAKSFFDVLQHESRFARAASAPNAYEPCLPVDGGFHAADKGHVRKGDFLSVDVF